MLVFDLPLLSPQQQQRKLEKQQDFAARDDYPKGWKIRRPI